MSEVIAKFYNGAQAKYRTTRVSVTDHGTLECQCKQVHCAHVVNVAKFLMGKIQTIPDNPKLYEETAKYTALPAVKARVASILKVVAQKKAAAEAAAVAFAEHEAKSAASIAGFGAALHEASSAPEGTKIVAAAPSVDAQAKAMEAAISQAVGGKAVQWVKESGEVVHSIPAAPPKATAGEKFDLAKNPLATPFRWIDMDSDELAAAKAAYEKAIADKAAQAKALLDAEKAKTEAYKQKQAAEGEKPAQKPTSLIEID